MNLLLFFLFPPPHGYRSRVGTPDTTSDEQMRLNSHNKNSAAPEASVTFEVILAVLSEIAVNQSHPSREPNPELSYPINGYAWMYDVNYLLTLPLAETNADLSSDAGDYTIYPSGGDAENYAFDYKEGIMVITQASAGISLSDTVLNYDGTPRDPTITNDPTGLHYTLTYHTFSAGDARIPKIGF